MLGIFAHNGSIVSSIQSASTFEGRYGIICRAGLNIPPRPLMVDASISQQLGLIPKAPVSLVNSKRQLWFSTEVRINGEAYLCRLGEPAQSPPQPGWDEPFAGAGG